MSTIEWLITQTVEGCTRMARVVDWGPARAPQGLGSILLGPHEAGLQALVPPGVALLSPDETDPDSVEGWRHAVWDEIALRGRGILDRPTHLGLETFLYVAVAVQIHAPTQRRWLELQARQHIGTLRTLVACAQLDAETLHERQRERDNLLLDAAEVFGEEWVCANAPALPCPAPEVFLEAKWSRRSGRRTRPTSTEPRPNRDADADLDAGRSARP